MNTQYGTNQIWKSKVSPVRNNNDMHNVYNWSEVIPLNRLNGPA